MDTATGLSPIRKAAGFIDPLSPEAPSRRQIIVVIVRETIKTENPKYSLTD
jgi:hypothetical protein